MHVRWDVFLANARGHQFCFQSGFINGAGFSRAAHCRQQRMSHNKLGGARRAETWPRFERVADLQFFVLLRTEDRLLVSAWLV